MQAIADLFQIPKSILSYAVKSKEIGMMSYWLLFVLWNIVAYNGPLLLFSIGELDFTAVSSLFIVMNLLLLILFITLLFLFPIGFIFPWAIKPLTLLLLVLNSVAFYFIVTYNVILDKSLMGIIFNAQFDVATRYYHSNIFLYVGFLGLLPALLFSRYKIRPIIRLRLTVHTLFWIVVCVLAFYGTASTWLWFDKHGKQLGGLVLPWSYVINTGLLVSDSQVELSK